MANFKKPLVLIGMMGSGKSTIGKRLSYKLNLQFYDTDQIIEAKEKLTILEIFDFRGEEYFRKLESKVIKETLDYGTVVISIGGESFKNEEIRSSIKEKAISIWLKTDIEVLHERVSRRNTRPQFNNGNKMDTIKKMMEENYPVFEQADIIIESKNMEAHFVVDTIMSKLKSYQQ